MAKDERLGGLISEWLEAEAPPQVPERVLRSTFERTRKSKQQAGWRGFLGGLSLHRSVTALASAAVVVLGVAFALSFLANRPGLVGPAPSPTPSPAPTPDPWAAFIGTWISDPGDADDGIQTLTVERSAADSVDVLVVDTIASVCELGPSTMTGTGHVEALARLVIPRPDYTCDDGSEPHLLNGDPTPLNEFLRNLTYRLDKATGNLIVGESEVWVRQETEIPGESPRPSEPAPSAAPSGEPTAGSMWPQSTFEEVREAQDRADAGDPEYTWQVDPALVDGAAPWGSEILDRFIREELGWEEFKTGDGYAYGEGGGLYDELVIFRCAPGQTNPLYPDDPEGRECAPTIDDFRYETAMLTLERPARRDPSGIWVVTRRQMLEPGEPRSIFDHLYPDFTGRQLEQVAPPSDAEATALVEAFLEARMDGEGAEQYVHRHEGEDPISNSESVPMLLYATTEGAPYERYETDRLQGPEWPSGWMEFRTRLFAADETVVEQSFAVIRQEDGRLGLVYGYPATDEFPTTENGQPVPIPYSFLDGTVTFAADPRWNGAGGVLGSGEGPVFAQYLGNPGHGERFEIVPDPLPVETGCESGPAPADAEALAQSIQSDPDLEATAPVAVSVGGVDALQIDVVAAPGASVCNDGGGGPQVLTTAGETPSVGGLGQGDRMRLYLLDLPGGSDQVLAIAIAAPESEFERVVEAATPIVDSIEFHVP